MLPTIPLGEANISRLIVGGNPFSGNSHVSRRMDADMEDFFTTERIKQTFRACESSGINAAQLRGDKHILRILREYRLQGGRMHWIAQTTPESLSFETNIRQIASYGPVAIYHHGTVTDALFKAGEYQELQRRLEIIRQTGVPVGLGTHMPEVIEYAETHSWHVDFYMACVYNLSRANRVSSAVTGISNEEEPFFEEDIPVMYRMIRQVHKPCLAFKILGATRRCATQDQVRDAFLEAYANIKPSDAVVVGMYPRDIDQMTLNSHYAREGIKAAAMPENGNEEMKS